MVWYARIIRGIILLSILIVTAGVPGIAVAQELPPAIDEAVTSESSQAEIQFTGCNIINFAPVNAAYEQRVVELANDIRVSNGRLPLKRNTDLDNASRYHARDMMEDNYFSHDTKDPSGGSHVVVCAWNTRIEKWYYPRAYLGENIAAGYSTPDAVIQGWWNSDGHQANMLNSNYREIGVGYYNGGGQYSRYWVQDFGSRSAVYPIVINHEYAQTDNPDVTLHIYGQGVWNEMRLRNDNDAWGAWQPFQSTLAWRLNWVQGERTVSVELRRTGQATGAASSDTIQLTTGGAALQVAPQEMLFIYNLAKNELQPPAYTLVPSNANGSLPMNWSLVRNGNWIQLSTTSGVTPNGSANVSVNPSSFGSPGTFNGSLTVTVTSPQNTEGSPWVVPVRLVVVEDMPHKVFLPTMTR